MKYHIRCLALLALALAADISAAPRTCVEEAGTPYTDSMPSNLRLLPVCSNAKKMYPGHIHWVFRGHITLTGELRSESWGEAGGEDVLEPNPATRAQLPSTVNVVYLWDRTGNSALHRPKTNISEQSCIFAPATIEFAELSVVEDESDRSGAWVSEYKVVSIGKWRKCQAQ